MKWLTNNLLILVLALFVSSCYKDTSGGDHPKVDVYVVGSANANSSGKVEAAYWKNGALQLLDTSAYYSYGTAVAVVGNDVYVSGVAQNPGSSLYAAYWKNNKKYVLVYPADHLSSGAIDMIAQDTDVYISGFIRKPGADDAGLLSYPELWKNGVSLGVTNTSVSIQPQAMDVNGTDVYVTDVVEPAAGGNSFYPEYFKNGVQQPLQYNGYTSVVAEKIAINGNDVYLAGYGTQNNTAIPLYWKNGTPTPLGIATGYTQGTASAIAFHGSDVYVAGNSITAANQRFTATIWKNGVPILLAGNSADSYAIALAIAGDDIYVAGMDINGQPCYWKNGKLFELPQQPGNTNTATGITLVKK